MTPRFKRKRRSSPRPALSNRRGSVLVMVLVLMVLLTFSAVIYVSRSTTEARATAATVWRLQAELAMDSEIEKAAHDIDQQLTNHRNNNPAHQFTTGTRSNETRSTTTNTAATIVHLATTRQEVQYRPGLRDESACINLNAIPVDGTDVEGERRWLLPLPGMTPQLADAILDWIDADDSPRPFGAELSYYSAQQSRITPANGPLTDLSELLQVRGVTHELLFGADRNQDGWLQPNERRDTPSTLESVGLLGWSEWLTLHSEESNHGPSGAPRIDLNQPSLPTLYRQLRSTFGPREAFFIVAYRLFGSLEVEQDRIDEFLKAKSLDRSRRNGSENRTSPKTPSNEAAPPIDEMETEDEELVVDGVMISTQPAFRVRSPLDLIGVSVRVQSGGVDEIVDSPWSSDPNSVARSFRLLDSHCTTTPGPSVAGRINIMKAPSVVLQCIPGIDRSLAERIIQSRERERSLDQLELPWLYESGLLSLKELRRIAPFLTVGGDVSLGISIGTSNGGPTVAVRFRVDATSRPSHVITLNRIDGLSAAVWSTLKSIREDR